MGFAGKRLERQANFGGPDRPRRLRVTRPSLPTTEINGRVHTRETVHYWSW